MNEQKDELVEVFALWEKTSKNGEIFLTGKFGNADLIVFRNKKKEGNQPDFRAYAKKAFKKDRNMDALNQTPAFNSTYKAPQGNFDNSDDIAL